MERKLARTRHHSQTQTLLQYGYLPQNIKALYANGSDFLHDVQHDAGRKRVRSKVEQRCVLTDMDQQLILLPTTQLLERFGAGNHVPGSGSAAAFSGILACKLCLTVIKLTRVKEDYVAVEPQMNFIETQIVDILEPALFDAFQKDSDEFDKVIQVRFQRKQETDLKKRKQLADQARELLRPATEVPVQICELCHSVCQHAISLFDLGFQSARGDSGTAATLALAGASGALFTCYLNLKEFRSGTWAKEMRRRCDQLLQRSTDLQLDLFSRVARLQEEGIEPSAVQLELKMD